MMHCPKDDIFKSALTVKILFSGLLEPEGADRESRARVSEAVLGWKSGQVDLHEENERVLDCALPTNDHDQVRLK